MPCCALSGAVGTALNSSGKQRVNRKGDSLQKETANWRRSGTCGRYCNVLSCLGKNILQDMKIRKEMESTGLEGIGSRTC